MIRPAMMTMFMPDPPEGVRTQFLGAL